MTDWQGVWLAVMAISLAMMAMIQVGLIVAGLRVARRLTAAVEDVRREIRPLADKLNRVADQAERAATLVVIQAERLDEMIANTSAQVDQAVGLVRNLMGGPLRQGAAFFMALRAALSVFAGGRRPERGPARDDDDALFVG